MSRTSKPLVKPGVHSFVLLGIVLQLVSVPFSLVAAPVPEKPSRGNPNILVMLADDLGFSDLGCYGSEIETPNLDRLAAKGVRFTQFYNTAKCHSSRVSLLTGRWCRQAGNTGLSRAVTIPEVLAPAGYFTAMTGKWHLNEQPTDFGFQRYFGHLSGMTDYYKGNKYFRLNGKPWTVPAQGFYTTVANVDYALNFLGEARAEKKPWLLYIAFNAPHSPLQPLEADYKKYLGRYDSGWDTMRAARVAKQKQLGLFGRDVDPAPRPEHVPAWDALKAELRAWEARRMAAYAGLIDRVDQEIGRLLRDIEAKGELDNTIVMFFSDNGACAFDTGLIDKDHEPYEPGTHWNDSTGWAWARNSPFRLYKQNQFEGGIASPAIIHWPAGITLKPGALVHAPAHLVDVLPTLADITRAKIPDTYPGRTPTALAGVSLAPLLAGKEAAPRPPIHLLYSTDRGLRDGDWKLVSFQSQPWELYNITEDRTELRNLAAKHPDLVARLEKQWHQMAKEDLHALPKEQLPVAKTATGQQNERWSDYTGAKPPQTAGVVKKISPKKAASPAAPSNAGPQTVARHSIVLNAPAGVPTHLMAAGPLLGNGDVGVMQSGPADQLVFYIGKNDFWSIKSQSPITVGQLRILATALEGAKFQTVSDLLLAELRGTYINGASAMTSRAWVDANHNLLCVELSNTGSKPLALKLEVFMGAVSVTPSSAPASDNPVMIGCEQHGGGRWFFNGEMADVHILDRALGREDIAALTKQERKNIQPFDGKVGKVLPAPAISKEITISTWIKAASLSPEADYMVSKGEWNSAYSLGLSNGRLRFAIGGNYVQADDPIPLNQWLHVAGVYDGKKIVLLADGKVLKSTGGFAPVAGGVFLYEPDAPVAAGRKVGVATRVLGADSPGQFTLAPGASAVIATAVLSDLDAKGANPLESAQAMLASLTHEKIAANTAAHRHWWNDYWSQSFIEIPDKTIEQCWYASWYVMGSCSRAGKVAPGLWGNWITVNNPEWHGDFHLNYNFQAPFYGLYSANHAETTLPFYDALNQAIPIGKKIAQANGWKGIHLPCGLGPGGMTPFGENLDHGQRSNTAYAALLFIWYWQHTQDKEWLKSTGYTYLRETAAFWEDYLKFENNRYVITNDSIHEGSGPDRNGLLSLGLVKTLFRNMIPLSEALGVDADKRDKWRDIALNISDFPLQEKEGTTVFRYTEKGTAWWNDNTLGIQHIFPAGAIGLDSDPKLLEISRNMIDAMGRWRDFNGSSSWYTACARVGYDPKKILSELRGMYDRHTLPNKLLNFGGGGIENVSPALGVTEMLMQSHEGVIRLFPCWPKELDARFGTLRAAGAFLVSAELKGGIISGVKITSEKGRDCTLVNPWPEKAVRVMRNGRSAETAAGPHFTLKTISGEALSLKPE